MNAEKLAKLQSQVRIGGPGTARRKKKVVHRTATTDDKKLQSSLKKLTVNNIPGIEEVNMFKDDGTIIHFNNPKVQASLAANTFAITGHAEIKPITDMLPSILNQLPQESLAHLKERIVGASASQGISSSIPLTTTEEDDEVPDLVENFDEPSKKEASTVEAKPAAVESVKADELAEAVASVVTIAEPPAATAVGEPVAVETPTETAAASPAPVEPAAAPAPVEAAPETPAASPAVVVESSEPAAVAPVASEEPKQE